MFIYVYYTYTPNILYMYIYIHAYVHITYIIFAIHIAHFKNIYLTSVVI